MESLNISLAPSVNVISIFKCHQNLLFAQLFHNKLSAAQCLMYCKLLHKSLSPKLRGRLILFGGYTGVIRPVDCW